MNLCACLEVQVQQGFSLVITGYGLSLQICSARPSVAPHSSPELSKVPNQRTYPKADLESLYDLMHIP